MRLASLADFKMALDSNAISTAELLSYREAMGLPFRWHPLGFIACTLLTQGSKKVRLHYWPSMSARPQTGQCQIHDHIFDFTSWVLAGAVENIEYEENESGTEFSIYKAEYKAEFSMLTKTAQTIRLAVGRARTYSAGSKYEVQARRLHETRRIGPEAALTILITDDISMGAPTVVGPINGDLSREYVRSILSDADLLHVLGKG